MQNFNRLLKGKIQQYQAFLEAGKNIQQLKFY